MTEEEKAEIWNEAVIACSGVAWRFHESLGSSLFALLIHGTVKSTGMAIAKEILDLAKPTKPRWSQSSSGGKVLNER